MDFFHLELHALAKQLSEQLVSQGLILKAGGDITVFQRDADALTRCSIRGLVSDSAVHAGRKRLIKNIAAAVAAKD